MIWKVNKDNRHLTPPNGGDSMYEGVTTRKDKQMKKTDKALESAIECLSKGVDKLDNRLECVELALFEEGVMNTTGDYKCETCMDGDDLEKNEVCGECGFNTKEDCDICNNGDNLDHEEFCDTCSTLGIHLGDGDNTDVILDAIRGVTTRLDGIEEHLFGDKKGNDEDCVIRKQVSKSDIDLDELREVAEDYQMWIDSRGCDDCLEIICDDCDAEQEIFYENIANAAIFMLYGDDID